MTGPETIDLPADLLAAAGLTPEAARLAVCLGLFHSGRLSRDQARDFSGDAAQFEALLFPDRDQLDLNDFLDWASHDLKTPLNLIIGFSKVVLKGIDGPINETQQTDLTSVHNNGQRLLSLISMLVDIARLNKGALHLSLDEVDLVELLNQSARRWRARNPTRELTTTIALSSPVLQLDLSRMKQLLAGALTFSAIHVTEGGTLRLNADADDQRATVFIESRGSRDPAMPELEAQMLRFINGSLVRLHGGDLTVSDNPGGGVTVHFWLPRA
jgi:signal transduction histidine kinase